MKVIPHLNSFAEKLESSPIVRVSSKLLIAFIGIYIAYSAFAHQREATRTSQIATAWQIVSSKSAGNSGKIEALQFLNSNGYVLDRIDLSSPKNEFPGVSLACLHMENASLKQVDMEYADLGASDFQGANLFNASLMRTQLQGSNFSGSDLSAAHLRWANIAGVNLEGADLSYTTLLGAMLQHQHYPSFGCEELKKAKNWHLAYRDEVLACGATIPVGDSS